MNLFKYHCEVFRAFHDCAYIKAELVPHDYGNEKIHFSEEFKRSGPVNQSRCAFSGARSSVHNI